MIDLMLDADRKQTIGRQRPRLTVEVKIANNNVFGAFDLFVHTGDRQATFLADLFALAGKNLGVDEHLKLVPRFGNINDNKLLMHVDLRCR